MSGWDARGGGAPTFVNDQWPSSDKMQNKRLLKAGLFAYWSNFKSQHFLLASVGHAVVQELGVLVMSLGTNNIGGGGMGTRCV